MLALWLSVAGLIAVSVSAATIDPRVLTQTATGDAEFLVVLTDQADLSDAAKLATKEEKGWFVYNKLLEAAARSQKPVLDHLDKLGAKVQPFWIANMIWARGSRAAVDAIAQRADVARLSGNPSIQQILPPPEPAAPTIVASVEWNLNTIHATNVWALGYTGQGVVVAGQDTGYQWFHPALINKYRGYTGSATNHNYNWHDAIHSGGGVCGANSAFPCDDHYHGTHTMGTMIGDDGGANQIGVAPGARWIGCRNMDQGNGTPATYAECFQWFIAPTDLANQNPDPSKAPDVINNSWGCPPSEGCTDPVVLKTIVENTRAAGIVVVVSAGNSGSGCASVVDPAAIYDASFSVGATDSGDNIASFSSRGPVTIDGSNRMKPDISAPGMSVRSSEPGNSYGSLSGTSMAGPHIAGIVALIISAHPTLRGQPDKIETLIEQTAVPRTTTQTCGSVLGSQIPNNTYGWGRADALAALALGDTDNDGMPDWWEISEGLNKASGVDAALDPDGDGFSNLQEYLAGTDPHDAASALRITAVAASGLVTFTSVTNKLYRVDRSTTLATNDWTTVTNNIAGTGALVAVSDPAATNAAIFYRVRLLP